MKSSRGVLLCLLALASFPAPAVAQTVSPQIVNGLPTSDWAGVALLSTPSGSCSATFIGCRTVLTAAHCVCDPGGTGDACPDGTFLEDPAGILGFVQHAGFFLVKSIRVPPTYSFGVSSDLAVLELNFPVRGIRPSPINTLTRSPFGTVGKIVGFGESSTSAFDSGVKREGAVSTASCAGSAPDATHVCWSFDAPVGPPGTDSNTCFGDSGGPLFADVGAGTVVIGVTSGGTNSTCQANEISFDADVFVDRTWIQAQGGADLGYTMCGDGAQVGDPQVITIAEGGVVSTQAFHSFSVPVGTKQLRVGLNFESGAPSNDFDLFVKFGSPPSPSDFDCASVFADSFPEFCEFPDPAPGTWHVSVDVFAGGAGEYQLTATLLPENPAPPPLALGAAVVADFAAWEVMQVDPASGDRAITSSPLRGSGHELVRSEDVFFDADDSIVVTNLGTLALLRIDPATGDRSVISGCVDPACASRIGAGPDFLGPRLIAIEKDGRFVVTDRFGISISGIMRVDPTSGDRSLVSGCADVSCSSVVGAGPTLDRVFGIAVEAEGDLLVADTLALFRIDPASGDRTVLSGCVDPACTVEVGSGPSFGEPIGVALDADGDVLVTDSATGSPFRAVFRVDPATGARTLLSGCGNPACTMLIGAGPNFSDGLWGIAIEASGDLLVSDFELGAVFRVASLTGDRTLVSGCVNASCSSVAGSGTQFTEPLGIAVLPPDTDNDGWSDPFDNCPFVANGAAEPLGQPTWGGQAVSTQYPGVGCACLCGDPNRDCAINVGDAPEAQRAGLFPPLSPLSPFFDIDFCDINGDGLCNVGDAPEMQRAGLFPPLPPLSPNFDVTGCIGYQGP